MYSIFHFYNPDTAERITSEGKARLSEINAALRKWQEMGRPEELNGHCTAMLAGFIESESRKTEGHIQIR